jgi:hypothetical protein
MIVKVTLFGPPPWGGSCTIPLTDQFMRDKVAEMVEDGWTVERAWAIRLYTSDRY